MMINDHTLSLSTMLAWVFFLSVLGVTMAIPMKRQMINVEQLRFPSGVLASCTSSYGYSGQNRYRVITTKGWFELEPATSYTELRMRIRRAGVTEEKDMPQRDHFAAEMDHFSDCVLNDRKPRTPGEEGLADMRVIAAIEESARTGKTVKLEA